MANRYFDTQRGPGNVIVFDVQVVGGLRHVLAGSTCIQINHSPGRPLVGTSLESAGARTVYVTAERRVVKVCAERRILRVARERFNVSD